MLHQFKPVFMAGKGKGLLSMPKALTKLPLKPKMISSLLFPEIHLCSTKNYIHKGHKHF